MLSVKQAAERIGVSEALVYEWCSSGMLTHFRLGAHGKRGSIRIAEVDLDAFLAARREGGWHLVAPPSQKSRPLVLKHLRRS
jgi:excisionase family DNA binding protein